MSDNSIYRRNKWSIWARNASIRALLLFRLSLLQTWFCEAHIQSLISNAVGCYNNASEPSVSSPSYGSTCYMELWSLSPPFSYSTHGNFCIPFLATEYERYFLIHKCNPMEMKCPSIMLQKIIRIQTKFNVFSSNFLWPFKSCTYLPN